MKKIYFVLVLTLGFLSTVNVIAQTSVTSSGISVQGIARDNNNEASANIDQLDLKFEVYYFVGASTTPTIFLTALPTVKTDNFGVFSYVLSINQDQSNLISSQSAYLRVSSVTAGNAVFSDEKLQTVPYAIFAQNGVPTGSIMPYLGTTAPNGWLLCDGTDIPSGIIYDKLKTLLGTSYTPDLKGLFLRGTGIATSASSRVGPALKVVQQDDIVTHRHDLGTTATMGYSGDHNHSASSQDYNRVIKYDGTGTGTGFDNSTGGGVEPNIASSRAIVNDGNHKHTLSGSTNYTGGSSETRPINYGVNYIIKI